jgi:N-acetylglucosaminyl-diphospho-decaprenol L-rhamnosyltransferase
MAASSSPSTTEPRRLSLGVIIVSFNTRDLLGRCLDSLITDLAMAGLAESQIWVVDNASSDGSAAWVAEHHPDVHLIALAANVGFTAGNNVVLAPWLAAPATCPDWIWLLNPDTEVRPGAIQALMAALVADPHTAVAGPRLIYPDGRFQPSAFRFPGLMQTALDLVPVPRLMDSPLNGRYPQSRYAAGQPFAVDFALGACLLVRGSAAYAVGPLDEGYFMYCEEIDWCRRFHRAGYRTLCVPAAVVVHHAGASTRQFRGPMFVQLWQSRLRYFARNEGPIRRRLLAGTVRLGLALRAAADWRATQRGALSSAERAERAEAYRRIREFGRA